MLLYHKMRYNMKERINMKKKILGIILVVCLLFTCGCSSSSNNNEEMLGIDFNTESNTISLDNYDTSNPLVAMYIKGYGAIVIELYPDVAPNTVNNFIYLVKSGFYDNNSFHRLVTDFVLQGGDPTGTGSGGPGYSIEGEFSSNGIENNLKHTEGVVSMARSSNYNSAGSQFFIMLGTATYLDGEYAAFGKVIDGMDIIKKIANSETISNASTGKLTKNLTIVKALVDTKGTEYPEPTKIEE